MGKSAPSAPAAPDPVATSQAQTQSNKDTALYNFGLNNPNYNTPLGSLSYTQTNGTPQYDMDSYNKALTAYQSHPATTTVANSSGYNKVTGSYNDGQGANVSSGTNASMPNLQDFLIPSSANPQYTANVNLSPEQQKLYDLQTSQSIDLGQLASALQGRVGDTLNQPLPGDADINALSKKAQDAYYNQQTAYLDPQFANQDNQLESKLANQGVMQGSEAYQKAMDQQNRNKTFAYNQAQQNSILQGPQNAQALFGLSTAARQLPLNEFNALRTGSQVQMPQFQGTSPASAQPTNVAGNIYSSFGAQQDAYNQQIASQNASTGGLFGLAGSLGAAGLMKYSDIRLKENIKHVGHENGFPLYHFSYRSDPDHITYRGVMAQDVLLTRPDAISTDGDYMMVNYDKIGIQFGRIH